MNFSSSLPSDVPAIHIHRADDNSALFNGGDMFSVDFNSLLQDASVYACSQGLRTDFPPSNPINPSELEDLPELSHLTTTTTSQPYLTNSGYSLPYSIVQENTSDDRGLSPSCLGSPLPSPTPSFGSSLSPSSFYDPFAFSDTEFCPSPDTPDSQTFWPSHALRHQSNESLVSHTSLAPDPYTLPGYPHAGPGPLRPRAKSSPSRTGPVASKAMLEANGRRRRHPPQFTCEECSQTFTALFSLKRHTQSHTGERPFACSIPGCSQRFYNSSDCKRHEKSKKRHKDLLVQ